MATIQDLWARIANRTDRGAKNADIGCLSAMNSDFSAASLEFDARQLPDTKAIRERIYRYGCVVIRSFLPVQQVMHYRGLTEECYESCVRFMRVLQIGDESSVDEIGDSRLREFVRNVRIGQVWPEWFEQLTAGISIYDVLGSEQGQFLTSLFGREWYRGAGVIRRVTPLASQQSKTWQEPIAMHCDGPALSKHTYSINVWVPLDDCGVDAPGLQLVPDSFRGLQEAVRHRPEDSYVDAALELDLQRFYSENRDGKPRFRPRLSRGDVVIFHNWVMHGTFCGPEMTRPRTSLELRFNAPEREDFERFAQ